MLLRQICYLLIIYGLRCHASVDYYEDYEEISVDAPVKIMTNNLIKILEDDGEKLKLENDVIKTQLETMSNTFRKTINKIKMKHKRIDIVFLVDSSSSVGKENFVNEISFVKRLLSDFNVSFNYTRVALITFSSRGKIVSDILEYLFLKDFFFFVSIYISTKYRNHRLKMTNAYF